MSRAHNVRESGYKQRAAAQEERERVSGSAARAIETLRHLTSEAARGNEVEFLRQAIEALRLEHDRLCAAEERIEAQHEQLQEMRAESERERARYRKLFAHSAEPYFVTDMNGTIREVNAAGKRILNAEAHAIVGKSLLSWLESESSRIVREAMTTISEKSNKEIEVRFLRRGGLLPTTGRIRGILFERGKRILFSVREDAPARTPSEPELPKETIEALVSERTAYLARGLREEYALRQRESEQRRLFERRDKAKDRFLAVLSHDLRGPLSAVLGWTQMLRREVLDPTMRERALATIERNAKSQLGLIEELLDLSRIVADKMPLEIVPLELAVLVERCVEAMMPVAIEKGVVLEYSALASGVTVFGDRKRLEQIITNLISNAIKFTPRYGRIDVSLGRDDDQARLVIRDTGRGIAADLLPHVFELFRQEEDSAASKKGLGLGLYIVRHLTDLHGGTVRAASDGEGRGATFEVLLPLRNDVTAVTANADDHDPTEDLEGCSILVVDDDRDTRDLVTTLLRQHKAQVSTVGDARTALAHFEKMRPDVLLIDIGLPDIDGCTLIEQLKQLADVPAIAVSGFATKRDVQRALDAGFAVHIAKPVETSALVRTVSGVWNKHPISE
jgi:PAS domain S-box-containing protein